MPTFSNIDGEESATVTFTVGAVSLTRNSSAELQEILVLGDPEVASSLGLARVTNTAPPSTNAALNVRIASGPSSVADLSVRPIAPSTYGDGGLYRVAQSTAADLLVRPIAPSTYGDGGLFRVAQSTAADLNVTVAGYSTTAQVSSLAGRVGVQPHSTEFASCGGFHFDSSGALQIAGSFSASTTVQVSSVGGIVKVAQDAPTGSSTPWAVRLSDGSTWLPVGADYVDGSTASSVTGPTILFDNGSNVTMRAVSLTLGLPVNVVGGTISASTTVQVSSVAGRVGVIPNSTEYASCGGFHFDSSGALQIAGSFSASTTAQVSSVAGRVAVMPNSTDFGSCGGFHFDSSGALQIAGSFSASTTVNVSSLAGIVASWLVSNSGASLSTDAAPASTSYGITVRQVGYSTIVAVSSLAGLVTAAPISSSGVSMSTDAEPASTKQGLIVRHVGRINIGSTATDNVVNVSSLAGIAAVRPSDTSWLSSAGAHFNSSGGLIVDQGSTVWIVSQVSSVAGVLKSQIMDSSNVTPNIVGTRPSTGAQGIAVRSVLNDLNSTCFSTMGNNSTSSTIVSSAASVKVKVYAYSITSTAQAVNTLSFASSLANPIWQVQMQSISSGITGANLAVTPPAWLFATEAASPLVFKVTGTTGTYHLSFSYFVEA